MPLSILFQAAHRLRLPGRLIHILMLSHRYVFLLAEEWGRLRTALRVRGFRNQANAHSYRTIGQVAGTLLVRGHERGERVGQAMRCRGFAGVFHSLHVFESSAWDVLAFVLLAALAVLLLAADGWLRGGFFSS